MPDYLNDSTRQLLEIMHRQARLHKAMSPNYENQFLERTKSFLTEQRVREMAQLSTYEQVHGRAIAILTTPLPDSLRNYRPHLHDIESKLFLTTRSDLWNQPAYLATFAQASALSNLYDGSSRVTRALTNANHTLTSELLIPGPLATYRLLLDTAGITLPRWPQFPKISGRGRKFRTRLKENAEPRHVRKAKSLVHRYERTLRDVIDATMTEVYGPDWPETRLPLCQGGKSLLNKWKSRGGEVLDHADYFHYAKIVANEEHFEAIFELGFDDPEEADRLLTHAGNLRAASHHARPFEPRDLLDLRVTWRTIAKALMAIERDYILEFD